MTTFLDRAMREPFVFGLDRLVLIKLADGWPSQRVFALDDLSDFTGSIQEAVHISLFGLEKRNIISFETETAGDAYVALNSGMRGYKITLTKLFESTGE